MKNVLSFIHLAAASCCFGCSPFDSKEAASAVDCANALTAYLQNWQTAGEQFLSEATRYDAETPQAGY